MPAMSKISTAVSGAAALMAASAFVAPSGMQQRCFLVVELCVVQSDWEAADCNVSFFIAF